MKPRVGISIGDPSGIGPEIVAKALMDPRVRRALVPVVFGDAAHQPHVVVSYLDAIDRVPGRASKNGGYAQFTYLQAVIAAAKRGEVDAICTAPVSKARIAKSGIPFVGHTEVLAAAFDVDVLMLMSGPKLKVALATNHLPLSQVPRALKKAKLTKQLALLSRSLGGRPRIAVCGVNPHAGEGGTMGREELDVIAPAVKAARKQGLDVHGPFAADGLYAKLNGRFEYDVVLAMFHDQGLCVAKALDFRNTVNVTLGLPVPRTSPDHGVAYDLAGRGKADPEPMVQALLMAVKLSVSQRH